MLRGLYAKCKQPIFFDFDTCLTSEVFLDIIQSAHTFVFTFMVYERKQRRRQEVMEGLWSNTQKFFHTASSEATQKLFFFSDPQHLIKLIWNHCIDSGVTLADGARVDRLLFQSCYWLIALNWNFVTRSAKHLSSYWKALLFDREFVPQPNSCLKLLRKLWRTNSLRKLDTQIS